MMSFKLVFLALSLLISVAITNGSVPNNHLFNVDEAIDMAIDKFESMQEYKMRNGFTSPAKRSYKKTK